MRFRVQHEKIMNVYTFVVLVICHASVSEGTGRTCARDKARIVRNVLKEKVYPVFKETKTVIPEKCMFNPERDIYLVHEEHKIMETLSKWYCNFCGKGFYSEHYLDMHFENRHPQYMRKEEGSVCYADVCDVMRCDILGGFRRAEFWDISLCLEDDMKDLREDCNRLMDDCIPSGQTKNATEYITTQLDEAVCSFLTCKKYWDSDVVEETGNVIWYSVTTVFFIILMIIYYCVAYHYFYTDTFTDSYAYDYAYEIKSKDKPERGTRRRILQDFDSPDFS